MAEEPKTQESIREGLREALRACSGCKMKHRDSHYGKNRVGVPLKTCQKCRNRAKERRRRERQLICRSCGRVYKRITYYERHTKVCKFIITHESNSIAGYYHRAFRKHRECFTSVLEQIRAI